MSDCLHCLIALSDRLNNNRVTRRNTRSFGVSSKVTRLFLKQRVAESPQSRSFTTYRLQNTVETTEMIKQPQLTMSSSGYTLALT